MSTIKIERNDCKYEITPLKEGASGLENEKIYKVIFIGDSGVGKTSLSIRATKGLFNVSAQATIGFDIFNYAATINNEITIKLQIWDTCGLEEFNACTTSLYKDSSLAIIVYAINDIRSFNNVPNWVNLLKKHASPETIMFLVGNKSDLETTRKVAKEACEQTKRTYDFGFSTETSAKDNKFVQELFTEGLIQLYELNKKYENGMGEKREELSKKNELLNKTNNNNKKKKKNCC
jgi:small GTP-binding protein